MLTPVIEGEAVGCMMSFICFKIIEQLNNSINFNSVVTEVFTL